MASEMTRDVIHYQETGEGWPALSEEIGLYVYRFPGKSAGWDEDSCSDFYLSFQPRIRGLVDRFRPEFSFETYLCCCLRWHMKTFREKQVRKEAYEKWWSDPRRACFDDCGRLLDPPDASSVDVDSCPLPLDNSGRIADKAIRKRLLYAALLRSVDLGSDDIEKIARVTGADADWLLERIRLARESIGWKVRNRERLRRRRNECWYQLENARRRVSGEEVRDGVYYREWKRREETWRLRYERAAGKLRNSRVSPSHREVARFLDVPPGTVSSGLHLLRRYWEETGMAGESGGYGKQQERTIQ